MAQLDEVPDELKDTNHTVPMADWEVIRAYVEENKDGS